MENVSNGNAGDSTLDGSNTYTGGTYILGGGLVLGDDATPGSGSIVGNVYMTNNVAAGYIRTLRPGYDYLRSRRQLHLPR